MPSLKNLFKCVIAPKENEPPKEKEVEKEIQKIYRIIDKSNDVGKEKIIEVRNEIEIMEKNIYRKVDEIKNKINLFQNQINGIEKEMNTINRMMVKLENEISVKTLNHTYRCF